MRQCKWLESILNYSKQGVLAEIVLNIPKAKMLYHLELYFKSNPNRQIHVFMAIPSDFMKENTKQAFFDIFTSFHLKSLEFGSLKIFLIKTYLYQYP